MNQREAFRELIEAMDEKLSTIMPSHWDWINQLDESLQPEHLHDMWDRIEQDDNPQHEGQGFGVEKLGRWLGWAQAAVAAMKLFSLEESKALNKKWADK